MDDKLSSKINLIRVLEINKTRLCLKIIVYYDVTNHLIFKQISVNYKLLYKWKNAGEERGHKSNNVFLGK